MVISTPPIGSSSTLTTPIQHKPPPVQHNYTVITNTNTAFNASDAVNISPAALVKSPNKPTSASSSSVASLLKLGDNLHPSLHPNHRPNTANKNGYVSRVGFDTLGCNDTAEYAFTLQAKTDGWRRCKKSRTFLVGTDLNEYSAHALSWTMENMLEDGDEVRPTLERKTKQPVDIIAVYVQTDRHPVCPKRGSEVTLSMNKSFKKVNGYHTKEDRIAGYGTHILHGGP